MNTSLKGHPEQAASATDAPRMQPANPGVPGAALSAEGLCVRLGQREVLSGRIGELVMRELKKLDKVAYIRFASVYRSFEDIDDFRAMVDEVRK